MCLAYLVVGMRAYSPIYLHIIVFIILNEAEQLVSIQADVACKMSKSPIKKVVYVSTLSHTAKPAAVLGAFCLTLRAR